MSVLLSSGSRRVLESACVDGRRVSEGACRAALGSLRVAEERVPAHLGEDDRVLRRGLRAKSRQLGDVGGSIALLVAECGFEQWHRLLFARFLAENDLLIHPEFRAPVTLAECEELAGDLGEQDGWAVAGRFAAEILPGIFRLDDPCVQLRLAPEGRLALEGIVAGLPAEVFTADDALGWVYQYWQRDKKEEVNNSERKIGGADLGPVTQLFTENYMVRFLLENSLGAWWAARHPDSPLIKVWEFLRFDDDGNPAAGSFDGWPATVGGVTVMDPCCGSGHFLVEAFTMLWQMRAEEEGLRPVAAQDAVLRDNLFGLELDPRCVQIAMFAVASAAWKAGGGWRELPTPNIACSGIPVKAPVDEWKQLADGDEQLENALVRLHILFRDADTLGSLIDPKRAVEITDPTGLQASFDDVDWDDIAPLLTKALTRETGDPATAVLGADAAGIARAADYLSRHYTLVATNPPFLGAQAATPKLATFCTSRYPVADSDLATAFQERCRELAQGGTITIVTPLGWLYLATYGPLRSQVLADQAISSLAILGSHAFEEITGEVVKVALFSATDQRAAGAALVLNVSHAPNATAKSAALKADAFSHVDTLTMRANRKNLLALGAGRTSGVPLSDLADSWQGLVTSDVNQYILYFWEADEGSKTWERYLTAPERADAYAGRSSILRWESGEGSLVSGGKAHNFNPHTALGRPGVLVAQMGALPAVLYAGEMFNDKSVPLIPHDSVLVPAIWAYAQSGELARDVRAINHSLSVGNGYFLQVPFDVERWRAEAERLYPDGLPEPWSEDPTQWLFEGRPEVATESLQVAVGRLVGFGWPEQAESDDLDELADEDGIVCLPSVLGERSAADRLQELLARAFGGTWSPARAGELLAKAGSKKRDLESWLREDFFKAHCQVFRHRPFVWHIWDGRKDGFAALVNYQRLDRPTLERLTYTYLGDWIERQIAGVRDDVAGAEERLAAARNLQRRLEMVLDGEPPYDIYVRWKSLAAQPTGWDPDLNDGVRLNVRPFVEAGVLRAKFNVKWEKDRGKNPDGTERHNNLHYTRADKETARKGPTT